MEIFDAWFNDFSPLSSVRSDDKSRTWSAPGTRTLHMRVWFDFSKITLSSGGQSHTFNFDVNDNFRGIEEVKTIFGQLATRSVFYMLASCVMNFDVLKTRSFDDYIRKVLFRRLDTKYFLSLSLNKITTGRKIIICDTEPDSWPADSTIVEYGENLTIRDEQKCVKYTEKITEHTFRFIQWVLHEKSSHFTCWEPNELSSIWKITSMTRDIYSCFYRSKFEKAIEYLRTCKQFEFQIPELQKPGFLMEVPSKQALPLAIFCFASADLFARPLEKDGKCFVQVRI